MDDQKLRGLLIESGELEMSRAQMAQAREWQRLHGHLFGELGRPGSTAQWVTAAALACILVAFGFGFMGNNFRGYNGSLAYSQQPGLYASYFYSNKAEADVVWISGLPEATEEGN